MHYLKTIWRTCASACLLALLTTSAHADTSHQEFAAALQKWQTAGIHDYSFALMRSCFCIDRPSMRITVKNGQVQRAYLVPSGAAVQAGQAGKPLSLSEILQQIEAAYAKPADHITLTLNPDYDYRS